MLKATFTQTTPEVVHTTDLAGAMANHDPFNPACVSIHAAIARTGAGRFTDSVSHRGGPEWIGLCLSYREIKARQVSCG